MDEQKVICGMPALFRYTGAVHGEAFRCIRHGNISVNISRATGMPLQIEPLPEKELNEGKVCTYPLDPIVGNTPHLTSPLRGEG